MQMREQRLVFSEITSIANSAHNRPCFLQNERAYRVIFHWRRQIYSDLNVVHFYERASLLSLNIIYLH